MQKYKIGLFGFGCVGQGFAELLEKNSSINAEIVKTAIKNPDKKRPKITGEFTTDHNEILDDPNIDLIVEVIDDVTAAKNIVLKALGKGKSVVSANKKMIAENLEELKTAEAVSSGVLLYEGAVCGSIPILSNLDHYFQFTDITSVSGIFNGSTNYILTKVIDEQLSYEEALQEAQDNGFAESDPTLDVEGFDPSFKLAILIEKVFGQKVDPSGIFRQGITHITKNDIAYAAENGLKIKLIAEAEKTKNGIQAYVAPHFVAATDKLATIDYEYNAVKVTSDTFGEQLLVGKGAGKLPTGLAVLADVARIINNNTSISEKRTEQLGFEEDETIEVYISTSEEVELPFFKVHEKFLGKKQSHFIGESSLAKLRAFQKKYANVSIIFLPEFQPKNGLSKLIYSTNLAIGADTI